MQNESFGISPVLPVQFSPRSFVFSPEEQLLWAVLEDAIGCIQNRQTMRHHRLAVEALTWVMDDTITQPFSFINLCDFLRLDAPYLRQGIQRLAAAQDRATRSQVAWEQYPSIRVARHVTYVCDLCHLLIQKGEGYRFYNSVESFAAHEPCVQGYLKTLTASTKTI